MGRSRSDLIILLWIALLLAGCGELTPPGERGERGEHADTYTIRPGDTLYSIAWNYGLDHRDVAAWNNIPPPYLIHPGDRIRLTPARAAPSQRTESRVATKSSSPSRATPPNKSDAKQRTKPKSPPRESTKPVRKSKKVRYASQMGVEKADRTPKISTGNWRWPTVGKVINKFEPGSGKKGIDIAGRKGQAIFSAAGGDVVYSGNGLLGYGNLVIIKHDDVYLSAYGHNSQLLVKEGDKVVVGQEIAKMGVSPKEGAMLHFEIRKEGKPVDPSGYLPKRN